MLHLHRALEAKCHRARYARLQSRHAGLVMVSDYAVAADFEKV